MAMTLSARDARRLAIQAQLLSAERPAAIVETVYGLTAVNIENHSQVLTSMKASRTWSHFQTLEATPIWFIRRRSTAMSFSLSLRNFASIGESGMNRYTATETTTLTRPQKRKMIWYECSRSEWMCPRPYDRRLPKMLTIPSMEYHAALRFVCSERLYHIWTTAMKAGAEHR